MFVNVTVASSPSSTVSSSVARSSIASSFSFVAFAKFPLSAVNAYFASFLFACSITLYSTPTGISVNLTLSPFPNVKSFVASPFSSVSYKTDIRTEETIRLHIWELDWEWILSQLFLLVQP